MLPLNFPEYPLQTKEESGKVLVFDPVRTSWVALLPEEWVRQHVIFFLINDKQYPKGLLSIEKGFSFQGRTNRADVVAYDRTGNPALMVECKAPDVRIEQSVFDQIARYNQVIRARYLYVTNGLQHFSFRINWDRHQYERIESIPDFHDI